MIAALDRQTYRNFDVVFVVKPSSDNTEHLLRKTSNYLNLTVVAQSTGHIVDAYFLGVKYTKGDIVAFLDDDAIPADDWLQETVKLFTEFDVAAVTGDSYPVLIKDDKINIIPECENPTAYSDNEFALFGHPLRGLEDYKNSIAISGLVYERGNNAYWRSHGIVKALLRGPSMAINGDVLRSIDLPGEWILGCAWEMVLGWLLWRRGLKLIYSPSVKVYHIVHGRTSSRDYLKPRNDLLWAVEAELLFYRLYGAEPTLSIVSKMQSDLFRIVLSLKHMRFNLVYNTRKIEGILLGNIIGAKWLLYKQLGLSYSPVADLKKLVKKAPPSVTKKTASGD